MKTVYKYPLPIRDVVVVEMPVGANVLHVGVQNEAVFLWALVDPEKAGRKEERHFRVAGTGHPIEDEDTTGYLGTVKLMEGGLVFHIFDLDAHLMITTE